MSRRVASFGFCRKWSSRKQAENRKAFRASRASRGIEALSEQLPFRPGEEEVGDEVGDRHAHCNTPCLLGERGPKHMKKVDKRLLKRQTAGDNDITNRGIRI